MYSALLNLMTLVPPYITKGGVLGSGFSFAESDDLGSNYITKGGVLGERSSPKRI